MTDFRSHKKIVVALAVVAAAAAVLRFFLKGWLDPLGVPVAIGSLLASVTVVLLVAIVILFSREGRARQGRYVRASIWFLVLALWCELLVIAGILVTERTQAQTYYQGPWRTVEEIFPSPTAHAVGHAQGFVVRAAVGLLLGAAVYALAKRRRSRAR